MEEKNIREEFDFIEMIQQELIDHLWSVRSPFLKSFVWDSTKLDNRLNRYVKQFKVEMFEAIKRENPWFVMNREESGVSNIEDYIFTNLCAMMYTTEMLKKENLTDEEFEEEFQEHLHYSGLSRIPDHQNTANVIFERLLDNRDLVGRIMNKYFIQTAQDIIAFQSANDDTITEYNFVKTTLPQTDVEYVRYYNDIFYKTFLEFDSLITTNEHMNEKLLKNEETYMRTIEENKKEIQTLGKTLEEKENTIQKLREMNEKMSEEKNRAIKNAVMDYQTENAELKKQIRMLEKELETCKIVPMNETKMKEEKMEEKKEPVEIDWDALKILFVSSDSSTFANDLQMSFPSSKMVYDNFKVNLSKYDCVVVITSHIDHATYQTFKQKCIACGTKFLHCPNTNVEKIKEIIMEKWV